MLDQVGLNDIFNRVAFFAYGGGEAIDPNRATIELMDNRFKQLAIHEVESLRIDFKHLEGGVCNVYVDGAAGFDLCVVPDTAQ